MTACLPTDVHAELQLVAHMAATQHGAALGAERVALDDLTDWRVRAVYTASVSDTTPASIPLGSDFDLSWLDARVRNVAASAGVDPEWLCGLVNGRSVMFDDAGVWAAAVLKVAADRRRALALAEELGQLLQAAS